MRPLLVCWGLTGGKGKRGDKREREMMNEMWGGRRNRNKKGRRVTGREGKK